MRLRRVYIIEKKVLLVNGKAAFRRSWNGMALVEYWNDFILDISFLFSSKMGKIEGFVYERKMEKGF